MRQPFITGLFLSLTIFSLSGYHPDPGLGPIRQTQTSQNVPLPYVSSLLRAPGPSPLIVYPNDTTVWFAGFATGNPPTSQVGEYSVSRGTFRQVLNFSNTSISAMVVDHNKVWFSENSTLALYNSTVGTMKPERTFPSQTIQSIVIDHQNRLWMSLTASGGANSVVRLDSDNTTQIYPVPTNNALAYGMAVGSDGTIWFVETFAKKIGHIGCDSCGITEFSLPQNLNIASPTQIAVDNSGNVWFTDHGDNEFGVFNPKTNTTKVLPTGYCQDYCVSALPNAMFLDNDNTIWFSEHIAGRVANYDPSTGILKEYVVSPNSPPGVWWAMPERNNLVWFVAWNLGDIGYVNATIPIQFSLVPPPGNIVVSRGGSSAVPVQVTGQNAGTLSFGLSPVTSDQQLFQTTAQIFGLSPPDLQLGTSQIVTFKISSAWNATLGPRYVALTAFNGQVAVSVHVRVTVVEASIPYIALGFSTIIGLGMLTIYLRRPKSLKRKTAERKR